MSDCCSSAPGFPNAGQMEQLALNHPVIWREICAIQQAILSAASQCQIDGGRMCTVVGGDTPMTFVGGIRGVTIDNPGAGYLVDHPSIEFIPPLGATPTVATTQVITNGGIITGVTITDPGAGYEPRHSTLSVSSIAGVGAVINPFVNMSGEIIGVDIVDGGVGYTVSDTIYATRAVEPNPAYTNAAFRITSVSPVGRIMSVAVVATGTGYQPSVTAMRVVSSLTNGLEYPVGYGFDARVNTDADGKITQVVINNGGAGYVDLGPVMTVADIGTGFKAQVSTANGAITAVNIINTGVNYTANATAAILNPATTTTLPTTPAALTLNVSVNNFGTVPELYHKVWSGALTNKQIQTQLTTVTSYFTQLGYSIVIQSNPNTGSTIQWKVCW